MQPPHHDPFFCQIFNAAPHPYLIVQADDDYTIVAVNDRYLKATGTSRDAIVGHGLFEIFPDNPEDNSSNSVGDLRTSLNRVRCSRNADIMGIQKYDIPLRDGSTDFKVKYWSPVNTPVFDQAGNVAYIIHHVEDITEFMLSREQAERSGKIEARAERMEAEIRQRAGEIKDSNRALKIAMEQLATLNERLTDLDRLKSEFFANVSHELRTPLTLILAPLEKRLQQHSDPSGEERRETEMMLRNARLLYRHVSDLLDAAKLDAGRMPIEYSAFDLADLTRTTAAQFQSLSADRGIDYGIDVPEEIDIEADSEKIQRIIINLLSNAFKFTPMGGRIELRLRRTDESALIEVEDNGPGIPQEFRHTVFERFSQVKGGSRRSFGGTGLGLAIVQHFVKLHGGHVDLAEGSSGGALFTIALPLHAPAGTEVVHSAPSRLDPIISHQAVDELRPHEDGHPADESGDSPLILVVEDNHDLNAFIAGNLRHTYRVVSAFDGREGLSKALALIPDLIMTDVMMPVMDGEEMVSQLRSHPGLADVPIIMLTAKVDDELRLKLLKCGIQDYLAKPFNMKEVVARVDGLVADRRRNIARLRQSERRYRELVQNANSAIIRWTGDGTVTFFNDYAQKFFGWPAEDIAGKKVGILIPEERKSPQSDHPQPIQEIIDDPEHHLNVVHENICRDGRRVWMTWTHRAIRDEQGNITEFLTIGNDITERRQAEFERERFRTVIEQTDEGVVITDNEGTIQYVNPAFERRTGFSSEESIGQNPRILKSGEHDEPFCRDLWGTITSGRTWKGRLVNKKKDGTTFTEATTISPIFDASGTIVNYVAIKQDITEHLLLEAQIQQSRKMESVGRLAGGVAHDFNNFLAIILGYAEMAMGQIDATHPLYGKLEKIHDAARRSADIVRQLLAFSRKQAISPKVLDLNATVEGMLKMLHRLIGENIELVWSPTTDLPSIKMDRSQLDQILANLCVNARDAITNIGRIVIETKAAVFDEEYCSLHPEFHPGTFALLSVSDNGCGMERSLIDNIFEPFFSTKGVQGTGLGLATVYGIVKQNNGFINVYSEPGKGSVFKIYLPLHAGAKQLEEQEKNQCATSKGETVLLVEDEPTLLEMSHSMLKRLGYQVLAASHPAMAIDLAHAHSGGIDLLMTDVIMPEMNGKELSERLHALIPGLKSLFVSGYTADVIAHHGVLDHNTHFLQKPFTQKELSVQLRKVLDDGTKF